MDVKRKVKGWEMPMKKVVRQWFGSAAGKISATLIVVSILFLCLAWSALGMAFFTEHNVDIINSFLVGVATNFLGIVVTVSFVQYFIDKQDKEQEKREESNKILRYHRYMQALIRRYQMFYLSVTTRLENRNEMVSLECVFDRQFKLSDMADLYKPSLYLAEGFSDSSIELFYKAEHEMKEYMLRMLENIDFKYYPDLARLLLDFTVKSTDSDVSGQILERAKMKRFTSRDTAIEIVEKMMEDQSTDWVEEYRQGRLRGNVILPYVILYDTIQDQARLIKEYIGCIKKMESSCDTAQFF